MKHKSSASQDGKTIYLKSLYVMEALIETQHLNIQSYIYSNVFLNVYIYIYISKHSKLYIYLNVFKYIFKKIQRFLKLKAVYIHPNFKCIFGQTGLEEKIETLRRDIKE